jgi:hypothetical protein
MILFDNPLAKLAGKMDLMKSQFERVGYYH